MKIELFRSDGSLPIRSCNIKREWMEEHPKKNPYKCNPMTVANGYGWEIYSPSTFTAIWDGNMGQSDVSGIAFRSKEKSPILPEHHFGNGILTWNTGFIFKTEYPYAMFVSAPTNTIIKNATPLSGIVETYWLPFSFTVNWKIDTPGVPITVNKGDVIAQIFPVQIDVFDEIEVEIKPMKDAPEEFKTNAKNWSTLRNKNLNSYQGHYHRGQIPGSEYKEPNRYSRIRPDWPEE